MKHLFYLVHLVFFSMLLNIASGQDDQIIPMEFLSEVQVTNLEAINTEYHEFSPIFYKDGFLYVSTEGDGQIDEDTGESFWDLFYAIKDENKSFVPLGKFSENFNSKDHEGPAGFSSNEEVIYFTRNREIFSASYSENGWRKPKELKLSNDDFQFCHPSLRSDDMAMVFASDMPGGFGKMDLYISFWNGISWSLAQNLGPTINSDGNELFPFWHASGLLFFASDGLPASRGGLDIYVSRLDNGRWSSSQNLGSSINSGSDDFGFILNKNGIEGFLSSNRLGGKGKDDLYQLLFERDITKTELPKEISLNIILLDEETSDAIANANIEIISSRSEEDNVSIQTNSEGKASISLLKNQAYIFQITKDGYDPKTEIISRLNSENQSYSLKALEKDCRYFTALILNKDNQVLGNSKLTILSECLEEVLVLQSDKHGYAEVCLPPDCNYQMTINRSGYKELSTQFLIKDTKDLRPERYILSSAEELSLIEESDLKEGAVIVLNNIYYQFNQYFIEEGAAKELNLLADIMKKYPDMKIQLSAHTDSRGEAGYNLDLSQKRADSAKRYLVKLGIDTKKIFSVGFGEQYLRNGCKDDVPCSEEDHQFNRRTEVRVLTINKDIEVKYNDGN